MSEIQGPQVSGEWLRKRRDEEDRRLREREDREQGEWRDGVIGSVAASFSREHGVELDSPEGRAIIERLEQAERDRLAAERAAHLRGLAASRIKAGNVPKRHLAKVWDAPPVDCIALAQVKAWLGTAQTFLVLSGGVGTRKTGSCCWALCQGAIGGGSVAFVRASDVAGLAAGSGAKADRWDRIRAVDWLLLDDLGTEYHDDKGWWLRSLELLLDDRYADDRRTLITSNLSTDVAKATYGVRIFDRFREAATWVDVEGASARTAPEVKP